MATIPFLFFYHLMDFCFAIFPVCARSNDPRLVDLGFWLMLALGLRSRLVDAAAVRIPRVEDDGSCVSYAGACGDFDFVLLRPVPGDSDRELRNSFFFFLFSPSPTLSFVAVLVVVEFFLVLVAAVVALALPRVTLGLRPSELFRCGLVFVVDGIRSDRGRRGALALSARCGRSFDVALLDARFWPLPPDLPLLLPPPPPTPLLLLLLFPFSSILPISLWSIRRDLDVDLSGAFKSVLNKFLALIRRLLNIILSALLLLLFPFFGDSAESALCDLRKFSVCNDNRLVSMLPSVLPRFELPFSTLLDRPDITSSAESSLLRLRCVTFPPPPPPPLEFSGDLFLFLLLLL